MDKNDLKHKGSEELKTMLKEAKAKLLKLRFELAENRLKNFNELKQTKKTIARALTGLKALEK